MRAHIIENDIITNTIEVESLDFMPNLIDASLGGSIGDIYDSSTGTFSKPVVPFDYSKVWSDIKVERDRRTQQGGYKVGTKWYHSDTFSRSQQLGLVLMGSNFPQGLMWKTMDGSFVEMTPTLAQQVFQSATISDSTIFAHAEGLNQQIQSSDNPESIDIYSGWPECYLDLAQ